MEEIWSVFNICNSSHCWKVSSFRSLGMYEVCSCCLDTQLKTAMVHSARMSLTPVPPTPGIFPTLLLPCHHCCPGPSFSELTLRNYSFWMLWMSEIKSASLFLPQYFGYKHSIWQWMHNAFNFIFAFHLFHSKVQKVMQRDWFKSASCTGATKKISYLKQKN